MGLQASQEANIAIQVSEHPEAVPTSTHLLCPSCLQGGPFMVPLVLTIHLTNRLLEPLLPTAFVCHFQVQCFCEHTSISTVFLIMVTQVPPSMASYWLNALTWCHKSHMIIT